MYESSCIAMHQTPQAPNKYLVILVKVPESAETIAYAKKDEKIYS